MLSFVNHVDQNAHGNFLMQLMRALFRKFQKKIVDAWNKGRQNSSVLEKAFEDFRKSGCEKSFGDKFIHEISPVLRDLTNSFRDGNWNLHLSALWQAMPLCFAFDRINYKRWLPD